MQNLSIDFLFLKADFQVKREMLSLHLVNIGVGELINVIPWDLDSIILALLQIGSGGDHAMISIVLHMVRILIIIVMLPNCLHTKQRYYYYF